MQNEWTEIAVNVPVEQAEPAGNIAHMVAPYGIYIEDYSHLEQEAMEIAHIDLIDEELLKKDRTKAVIHVYISPTEHPGEAVAFLRERFDAEGISYDIRAGNCAEEDWINNWKQYFHAMPIGKKLLIEPTWEAGEKEPGRAVLRIEPGLAFGTGAHATTRLCLETLEDFVTPDTSLLDVGCGSGILSVAGLLLGAKTAVGVDIDALAVKTARENGRDNGFEEPRYTVLKGNLSDQVSGNYDVVVANIVADVIILFCRDVGKFLKKDGVFITSGIIDSREADVTDAFEKYGFQIMERREEEGWLCFVTKLAGFPHEKVLHMDIHKKDPCKI